MNSENGKKKNSLLPIITAAAIALAVLIAVLAASLSKCGGNTDARDTAASLPTETDTETETEAPASDPDKAAAIWTSTMSGSGMTFELRVKPGVDYTIIEHEEYYLCTLAAKDGKTVTIYLTGLYYETKFEEMIGFLKQNDPEILSVGKESKTIIAVYDPTKTEAVFKLSDTDCITVVGTDIETIREMLRNVTMKTGENDYTVPDPNEEFEDR